MEKEFNNQKNSDYSLEKDYAELENILSKKEYESFSSRLFELLSEYPSDQYLLLLQAKMYYEKNEISKAKIILEDILVSSPDFYLARNNLGVIYYQLNETNKAINCLKYAYDNGNYNYDIIRNLADILLKEEQFEDSLKLYHHILKEYPADIEVLLILANLAFEAEKYDDSSQYAGAVLNIDRTNEDANTILNKVKMVQQMNDNEELQEKGEKKKLIL